MQPICIDDLDFPLMPITRHSSRGVAYQQWTRIGMPKISPRVIDSVFYLYASRENAEAGRAPGGTGFLVEHWEPGRSRPFYYAISNWHVARQRGFSVIRLNTNDGRTDVIDLGPEQWFCLAGKYDVAVFPLTFDRSIHKVSTVSTRDFVSEPEDPRYPAVGVGEDAFMLGLFVDHDGVTTNVPSARFGNVSMLPNENAKIRQPTGYYGVSYIVDMHSRSGFSGSPVFAYRTFGSDLTETPRILLGPSEIRNNLGAYYGELKHKPMFKVLGIHWASFPERWEIGNGDRIDEARRPHLVTDGDYVKGHSGMTLVIPAWQILEVLNMPQLRALRDAADKALQKHANTEPVAETHRPVVAPEAATAEADSEATNANPSHREDFTRLVDAASKKKPRGE